MGHFIINVLLTVKFKINDKMAQSYGENETLLFDF